MKEIAINDRYELKCDLEKNRLYIVIKGLWKTQEGYLQDLQTACSNLKEDFSMHVDLTSMKPPGQEIGKVHEQAQVIAQKNGLGATAEVQSDRALLRMALNRYSEKSGMQKQVFLSNEEAESWLNQL